MSHALKKPSAHPVKDWMSHLRLTSKLVAKKWTKGFTVKIPIYTETDTYILKTAETLQEIDLALKLRHLVFFEELQQKKKFFKIELDELDLNCDHLLIYSKQDSKVVGTYRLFSSHFFDRFYSEDEFDLTLFKKTPGHKLELGRACVLKEHRNGTVMQLLWRGISKYMQITDSRWLLGCSSVQTLDPSIITAMTFKLHHEGYTDNTFKVHPTHLYHPETHGIWFKNFTDPKIPLPAVEIPPLLHSYLKAGAKVALEPAIDVSFNCIDYLTIMDTQHMNPLFKRRFFNA